MESRDCKWLKTKDDGVLLFKNIAFSVKESDKEDKKETDYEHTEENCVIKFGQSEDRYQIGQRYFHEEMCVFCTITDRVMGDDDKLKELKIRLEGLESEGAVQYNEKALEVLNENIEVNIRIIQKTGSKITIKGTYSLFDNMSGNLKEILGTMGFSSANFKVFHKDKLLEKNADIEKIYEAGKEIYLMAFESLGKPRRWIRFPRAYEYGTWSNSGSCTDSIVYIPNKAIQVAGFLSYSAKDDPDYEMKYKLQIGGVVKEEGPPTKYQDWEETYYKTVMFNEVYDCPANSRIEITVWIARSFSSYSTVYTYYGTDGYSFADVQNEQMGLFQIESGSDSSNGTSVSSGQIPGLLYYSD